LIRDWQSGMKIITVLTLRNMAIDWTGDVG